MKESLRKLLVMAGLVLLLGGFAQAQEQFVRIQGAACTNPPTLHCPDKDCPSDRVINPGPVVEMKTRRTYFLDYPCDLKPGEKVTFILSLHGAGSYANWQRHYFPILDFATKYRLVIATPSSPTRTWSTADDEYLQNIVTSVVAQFGKDNIKAFWLAGHSQGGLTSNRIVRTDFFKDRVDGFLSLSGGRLGGNPGRASSFGRPGGPVAATGSSSATTTPAAGRAATGAAPSATTTGTATAQTLPSADFSHIYAIGEREIEAKGVPAESAWAAKYGCGPKRKSEIADTKAGYVYDGTRQNPPNPSWGLLPGPGKADVGVYSDCKDGRVVADVVRLAKGHTEGLEPNVTEEIVKLIVSAKGGKIQQSK